MKRIWMLVIGLSSVALATNVLAIKQGDSFNSVLIPINLGCIFFATYNISKLSRKQ